ncbi:MAG: hypothetical protein SP1CHLAM54_06030 [Chlamydiia bacterium]|nr:hypothetical protein [Chlamydiia bacterium]MCH9615513.1 hypothetical protein [Chlamydiia bacterium]MCH9629168.1 hypothetical protein [Chlamydiia bacterium]
MQQALDGSTYEHLDELYSLASAHYARDDFEAAMPLFQKLTMVMPLVKEYWFGFSSTLMMLKNYEKAVTAWTMTAMLDGADATPHFHAAECFYSLKDQEKGMQALAAARLRSEDEILNQKMDTLEKRWENV